MGSSLRTGGDEAEGSYFFIISLLLLLDIVNYVFFPWKIKIIRKKINHPSLRSTQGRKLIKSVFISTCLVKGT